MVEGLQLVVGWTALVISVLSWWRGCAYQSMVSVSDILVLVEVTTTTNLSFRFSSSGFDRMEEVWSPLISG